MVQSTDTNHIKLRKIIGKLPPGRARKKYEATLGGLLGKGGGGVLNHGQYGRESARFWGILSTLNFECDESKGDPSSNTFDPLGDCR